MALSFLRPWRHATDNNLITRGGVASSAQTVWRRKSHQSPGSPIRRFYSHQATPEDSEPAALSLAPHGAATAFQRRRLRARQSIEAKSPQESAVRAGKIPHRLPKPHKDLRRNDERLGKAARATRKVHLGRRTGAPELRKGGKQEYDGHFKRWAPVEAADVEHLQAVQEAVGAAQKAQDLARWAEKATEAASAAIVSSNEACAIQLADAARIEAELAALDAEQKAQLAADKEEAAEALRADMRARAEKQVPYWFLRRTKSAPRGALRAAVPLPCRICHAPHSLSECPLLFPTLDRGDSKVHPRYRDLFRDKLALDKKFREGIAYIQSTFQVSSGSSGEVVPLNRSITRHAPASAIKYLQEFDTVVAFKYIIGGKDGPGLTPVARDWGLQQGHYITKDHDGRSFGIYWPTNAPADTAADPDFLLEVQKIRSFVTEWGKGKKARYGQDPFSDMPSIDIVICVGRWHTTRTGSDDMHRSVLSLWVSNKELWAQGLYYKGIHIGTKDDEITSEYDWWSYGRPVMYGSPMTDLHAAPIPSSTLEVPVVFAKGLLRATLRNVVERVPPVLVTGLRKGDPVALSHHKRYNLVAKFRGAWKYGRASVQYRLIGNDARGPESRLAVGQSYPQWAPSWEVMMDPLADAQADEARKPRPLPRTLRRQRRLRARPSSAPDSTPTHHTPWASRYQMRSIMSPDAAPGTEVVSVAASTGHLRQGRGYQMRSIMSPDAAPGTEVVSVAASTGHLRQGRGYQMRSIMSPNIAPRTKAASSSDAGAPVVDSSSAPSASSQQKTPDFEIRKYVYNADFAQNGTGTSSKTDTNSTGRMSRPQKTWKQRKSTTRAEEILATPNLSPETAAGGSEAEQALVRRVTTLPETRQPRSTGYRPKALLSALDPSPEVPAAGGSSKPEEGRGAVKYRPSPWGRRQKGTNKTRKTDGYHEFPVPDVEDAHASFEWRAWDGRGRYS